MARRLPVQSPTPTVEVARKRLGGRAISDPGMGELVVVTTRLGLAKPGVVLFSAPDAVDVWIADDTVLRTTRDRTAPLGEPASRELSAAADDARVFAALSEGQRVRYLQMRAQADDAVRAVGSGSEAQGAIFAHATLVEKCRWGALLLRDDGTLVGVGFRRVWPVAGSTPTAN
jgi:hypothetical protein